MSTLRTLEERDRDPVPGTSSASHWLDAGNARLADLRFDDGAVSWELWDFVLSEEDRLRSARQAGHFIVGAMKDLGTIPVLVDALGQGARAFYPDGAWWLPCLQRHRGGQLAAADRLGMGEIFCPVRALLGCYAAGSDFPTPEVEICAVGATCDDFSAVAQRLAGMGRSLWWWELPAFRDADPDEATVTLPDGQEAPAVLSAYVVLELQRLRMLLERAAGRVISDGRLTAAVADAERIRARIRAIRELAFTASRAPIPALELLLTEILALHFCSDRERCELLLERLQAQVAARAASGDSHLRQDAVRIYWVNPVADLRVLNWLEEGGGRLCGTDFMTTQSLVPLAGEGVPLEALARAALCDRMIGGNARRARLIAAEAQRWGAEAVVVARIPGASHCPGEGAAVAQAVQDLGLPVAEIEVPPVADANAGQIRGRLEALVETVRERRSVGS